MPLRTAKTRFSPQKNAKNANHKAVLTFSDDLSIILHSDKTAEYRDIWTT